VDANTSYGPGCSAQATVLNDPGTPKIEVKPATSQAPSDAPAENIHGK
jgi:hypothetical protein